MFRSFSLLLFLALNLGLSGQNEDSLLIAKLDSSLQISSVNLDSGIVAISATRDLASELNNEVQRGRAEHFLGRCYRIKGETAEALRHHFVSRQIFANLGDTARVIGNDFEIGTCYASLKMYDKALECYFSALLYYGEGKGREYQENIGGLQMNIGGVYMQLGDYENAEGHLRIGIQNALARKDTMMMQSATPMLARTLYVLKNDSAAFYIAESERLFRLKPNFQAEIYHSMNMGESYRSLGEHEAARDVLERAFLLSTKYGDTFGQAEVAIELADTYLELGNLDSARRYTRIGMQIADDTGLPQVTLMGHRVQAKIFTQQGDYKRANRALESQLVLADSMQRRTELVEIGRQEGIFNVKLLEKEMEWQMKEMACVEEQSQKDKRNARLWYILAALSIFLLLVSGAFFLVWRQKNKKLLAQGELLQETLKTSLQLKQREAVNLASAISFKGELMEKVESVLKKMNRQQQPEESKEAIQNLNFELKQFKVREHEIEQLFNLGQEVQAEFYAQLKQQSDLTENELRLSTLIRLGMTTKEIASILNKSPKAVEMSKYRLKKKLDLPQESNLNEYINKL